MVDKDNMSVEEMLAYCRQTDGGESGSAPPSPAPAAESTPAAESAPAAAAPSAEAAREMSVEEMMAAARGETQAAAAPKAKPKPKAGAAAKPKAAKPAKAAPSGPKDTGSILAGARNPAKPGPMSKAEAEARKTQAAKPGKPVKAAPLMPERPAYATPAPAPAGSDEDAADRRGFFAAFGGVLLGSSMAVGFASLAVTNLLWVLGLARFMFPNILIEPPTRFKVGFPDDYAPGQVQPKYKAQFGVWVVRFEYQGESQIYALKSVCTHLGCTPNWLEGEQKFKCPCHGSGFYKDGINFEGPAPRPLERYAISKADDGQLEVDKSRQFNEEKGQWADPASYVKV